MLFRVISLVALGLCALSAALIADTGSAVIAWLCQWPDAIELLGLPLFFLGRTESAQSLKVMTLNISHGRGDSVHRVVQGQERTMENLSAVSDVLNREAPDVVSLQEVDDNSFWSGGFNHAKFLASASPFAQMLHGIHVDRFKLAYGTAILSNLALENQASITFKPKVPTLPKGFVIATVRWPGMPHTEIDVVSVHFDVFHSAIRQSQAKDLVHTLRARQRPVIISGDFNAEWHEKNSALKLLSEALRLKAYHPGKAGLETYPLLNKRLDWILISDHFEFQSYRVVTPLVSDHLSVVAELGLRREHVEPLSGVLHADSIRSASRRWRGPL